MLEINTNNGLTHLTMRNGKVNAMDIEFCQALRGTLSELAQSNETDVVILRGLPRVFSAGIDLKRWLNEPVDYVAPFLQELEGLFLDVFEFAKPMIAVIEGPAVAGGCMLAAACERRIMAPDATIGIPELRVGVPLPMAAIEIMRFVTTNVAFQSVVNVGKMYAGEEAKALGLATDCVPAENLNSTALEIAEAFRVIPRAAFSMTKRQSRLPSIENIRMLQAKLGEEYLSIWQDATTRAAVASYVRERLG